MKRILCIILALLLLTPAVFAAGENMELSISRIDAEVGDNVTIVGQVKGAPACSSFRVILTYDSTCLKITGGAIGSTVRGGYINTDATFQGKKAISALSADATKSFEGDTVLFTLNATVIGAPASGNSTPVSIAYYEFFDTSAKLQKVTPAILTEGYVSYPSLSQNPAPDGGNTNPGGTTNPEGGNTNPEGGNTNPEGGNTNPGGTTNPEGGNTNPGGTTNPEGGNTNPGGTTNPEGGNTNPGGTTNPEGGNTNPEGGNTTPNGGTETDKNEPAPEENKKPAEDKKPANDKKPTGEWIVVDDQFAHVDEDGNANLYEGEYEEPKNPGDKADVTLKDEDGNTVGSVVIEKDEAGNLNVIEQDLGAKKPIWPWVAGGVALAVAIAAVVVFLYQKNAKAKKEEENKTYIP